MRFPQHCGQSPVTQKRELFLSLYGTPVCQRSPICSYRQLGRHASLERSLVLTLKTPLNCHIPFTLFSPTQRGGHSKRVTRLVIQFKTDDHITNQAAPTSAQSSPRRQRRRFPTSTHARTRPATAHVQARVSRAPVALSLVPRRTRPSIALG